MTLHPSVAAVRNAVRRSLDGLDPGTSVLVACSGGADSLALLSATVFEGRRLGLRVVGATVDHGIQPGSDVHAAHVVDQMAGLDVDETAAARVRVQPGGLGPEAAARRARYDVLEQLRAHFGAALVLLGHTRDDQAETVLLGLTRGSGGRSLAGMRRRFDHYARPLLDVSRADTVAACRAEGIEWWTDPHNSDRGYARVRVRGEVMPVLERQLGPGVAEALARTADQVRDDVEALDALAETAHERVRTEDGVELRPLHGEYPAIASRVLRLAAVRAGATDSELFHVHVRALVELAAGTVRGEVQLPGHLTAVREGGRLRFRPTRVPS